MITASRYAMIVYRVVSTSLTREPGRTPVQSIQAQSPPSGAADCRTQAMKTLILRLINSRKRVVFEVFYDGLECTDASRAYSYQAEDAGGWGQSYDTVIQRALDTLEYSPSAKPDVAVGSASAVCDYLRAIDVSIARRAVPVVDERYASGSD